jgi:hypothetical protein
VDSKTALPVQGHVAPTPTAVQPLAAWYGRLGLSGKILGIAALVGIIATFLPSLTVSVDVPALKGVATAPGVNTSRSVMVLDDWRGKIELVGFIGALALAFVLYPPNGLAQNQKPLCWVGVGVGGTLALLALWLLIAVMTAGGGIDMGALGSVKSSAGLGAYVTLLAALAVSAGAFLKAREEQLI